MREPLETGKIKNEQFRVEDPKEVATLEILTALAAKQHSPNCPAAVAFPNNHRTANFRNKLKGSDYFIIDTNQDEERIAPSTQILVAPKKITPIVSTMNGRFDTKANYANIQGGPLHHILITQNETAKDHSVTLTLRRYTGVAGWDPKKVLLHIPDPSKPDEYYLHIQDIDWHSTKATITTYFHLEDGQFSAPQRVKVEAISQFAPLKISAVTSPIQTERRFNGVPQSATITNSVGIGAVESLERGFATVSPEARRGGTHLRLTAKSANLLCNPSALLAQAQNNNAPEVLAETLTAIWQRVDSETLFNRIHTYLPKIVNDIPTVADWRLLPIQNWYKVPRNSNSKLELYVCREGDRFLILLERHLEMARLSHFNEGQRKKTKKKNVYAVLAVSSLNYVPEIALFDCELKPPQNQFNKIEQRDDIHELRNIMLQDFVNILTE